MVLYPWKPLPQNPGFFNHETQQTAIENFSIRVKEPGFYDSAHANNIVVTFNRKLMPRCRWQLVFTFRKTQKLLSCCEQKLSVTFGKNSILIN